ncbi:MAG TPA: hypothetical protein VLD19_13635, partial [Chitinophagaceae bacterium]|nr:hypothetical protein [Chitinophagaceae bacterium]
MLFTLNVAFTNQQLETLFITGTNVVIGKTSNGRIAPTVAWQVMKPFEQNIITWEDNYGIYISATPIQNGEVIINNSSTAPNPVAESKLYTLQDSGVITGPSSGGTPNAFSLLNQYSDNPYMTCGIFQDATVNNKPVPGNCVSAEAVLLKNTAVLLPFVVAGIWLQSNVVSNTVVT